MKRILQKLLNFVRNCKGIRSRGRIIEIRVGNYFLFFWGILILMGFYSILMAQESKIHPVAADSARCNKCHENSSNNNQLETYVLKIDITAACLECHEQHAANHPVKVVPSFKVPKDLPVSEKSEIICITCHNPHNARYSKSLWQAASIVGKMGNIFSRKKRYKTFFLRRNNANGGLCLACHQEREGE